jgi:hypothetical protein
VHGLAVSERDIHDAAVVIFGLRRDHPAVLPKGVTDTSARRQRLPLARLSTMTIRTRTKTR